MTNWKCGKCGKEYVFNEFMKLPMIRVKTEEEDPTMNYGKTTVCFNCGYIFHKDKWINRETLKLKRSGIKIQLDVSTVFLEMDHNGNWYETMIFPEGSISCDYQKRYKTQEEAEKNHKRIVNKLKKGDFKLNTSEYEISIN